MIEGVKVGAERKRGIPSERASRLKEELLRSPYRLDIERARHYTDVWRRMGLYGEKQPCMRAAVALEETLRHMPISIQDEERLVGSKGSTILAEQLGVERGTLNGAIKMLFSPFAEKRIALPIGGLSEQRMQEVFNSVNREKRRELLRKILPYWEGRSFHDRKIMALAREGLYKGPALFGPISLYRLVRGLGGLRNAVDVLSKNVGSKVGQMNWRYLLMAPRALRLAYEMMPDLQYLLIDLQGHIVPGYHRVLEVGFEGIARMAESKAEELKASGKSVKELKRQLDFLQSVQVAAKAVCQFSYRYADLAEEMAKKAEGRRREELLAISERCRWVPARPPRTFWEALQSIWMTLVVLVISYGFDNVFTSGRVDQYLWPYYKADIEAGRITREEALEAIEEFLVKIAGNLVFGPNNITIGGLDREGKDATNEVSYLFLEALENIRGLGDGLAVRISDRTPHDFLIRAIKTHEITGGVAFYNDDIIIRDLLEEGYSLEDARDYSIVGCVEPAGTGFDNSYTAGNAINFVCCLEMALNRGKRLFVGARRVGARTKDPRRFRSFDEVKEAFERQVSHSVSTLVRMAEIKDRLFMQFPTPLLSATIEGCLESGLDLTWGGARYNNAHVNAQGLATVANSLAAIRWAVFEERIVSMPELIKALRRNFKGYEHLRQVLLRKAPKFGNDDDRVDGIAAWACEMFVNEVRKHKCWRGGRYRPSMFSSGTQDMEGSICGATPDGRLAGDPVSNGISPTNGTEWTGMTAVLHSVARAGSTFMSDGTALNINISPSTLANDENVEKMAALLEAYFVMGGRHVQFNPVDAETLRDAQNHPEKYPDLTVKVSGYSARFIDLSRSLQDDIIARTEFWEV